MHRRVALRTILSATTLLPGLPARITTKASRVILLYMTGGVSQVDTFDYKPELERADGKRLSNGAVLFKSQWTFKPRGRSGLYISDLFPHIAECADELCVLNAMRTDHTDHFEATLAMHGRPSLGASMPSFVVLSAGLPYGGALNWSGGSHIDSVPDPDLRDLSRESDSTLSLYGVERGRSEGFAWQCLMARRLAERGVRFVEVIDSAASTNNWDAHADIATHAMQAENVDRPIAALLKDLRRRGLLDDTLIVWTTEFGRTPYRTHLNGREHQGSAFSSWLAGGGVKGGVSYGESDEIGIKTGRNEVHVEDLHATIRYTLGLGPLPDGRGSVAGGNRRSSGNGRGSDEGRVVTEILV